MDNGRISDVPDGQDEEDFVAGLAHKLNTSFLVGMATGLSPEASGIVAKHLRSSLEKKTPSQPLDIDDLELGRLTLDIRKLEKLTERNYKMMTLATHLVSVFLLCTVVFMGGVAWLQMIF